ncbi:serine/threonine-protein kinase [Bryobacter aggregatus]|uniref:serine/threonine-protein kinase n=1 Tax=Bryobacter aggregatus TaxID=360054 RepID=UPI00068EED67|nr:serine/threonine-protein kinase [Bryobacter aggregatus]
MNKTHWPRVEELFHELADAPEPERAARLAGELEEVRAAVLRLLATEGGDAVITTTVKKAARMVTLPEKRIGAYEILHEIGHGGMGAVYLGRRADSTYEKQVAIKFVRSGMDSPLLRQRFEAERRILARLEHPYIARLLDAGTAANGQPYFVMEYVEGKPVGQWAAEQHVSLRARVELFVKVCEAVLYAHQNLVVHRDLKPTNILVTQEGIPKLLDFGIAKLLEEEGGAQATVLRILTPDYASPEQARGDAVSVASDVYSLGAVLYELLAGEPPFQLAGLSPAESERQVCYSDAPKPSLKAPSLAGDLDTVILKTLRKDPAERYEGVGELRADLLRYLEGKPVTARQYTIRQRAMKWVRRHRTVTVASAAMVLSIVVGSGMALWSAHDAQEARKLAERERQRAELKSEEAEWKAAEALEQRRIANDLRDMAEQRFEEQRKLVGDSLRNFYDTVERLPGSTQARLQLLTLAAGAVEKLAKEEPDDARLQIDLAAYYQRLGEVLGAASRASMGDRRAAMAEYQKALSLLNKLKAKTPEDLAVWKALSAIHERIATLEAYISAEPKASVETSKLAVKEAEYVLRTAPADPAGNLLLVSALVNPHAALYRRDPRLVDVVGFSRAEKILLQRLQQTPEDLDAKSRLSMVQSIQGNILVQQLNLPAALERLTKVKKMREEIVRAAPNDSEVKRSLMMTNSHIADVYVRMNRINDPGSYAANEAMAQLGAELAQEDPDNVTAQYDYAMSLTRVASFHRRMKDYPKALAGTEKSLAILETLKKGESKNRVFVAQYFGALNNFADTLRDSGRTSDALKAYRRQAQEWEALPPTNEDLLTGTQRIRSYQRYADALANVGDRQALDYASRVIEEARDLEIKNQKDDFTYIRILRYEGEAGVVLTRFAEAENNRELWIRGWDVLSHCFDVLAGMDTSKFPDWNDADRLPLRKAYDRAKSVLAMK